MNYTNTRTNKKFKKVVTLFGKDVKIPKEWQYIKLSEKCIGKAKYGANISAKAKNLKLPRYIRITDLNDDGSLRDLEWKSVLEEDVKDYLLNDGDVLFARTGATVGKTYIHQKNDVKYAFASYLVRFKPDNKHLNSKFLFYLTHSKPYWIWLLSIQTWGVQPNVNAEQYSNMPILLPTIKEQQKIASILSKVDALIETTQECIEKTQKLKNGLLQTLLTKGINHKKFKKIKTMFNKYELIPEEWKIIQFNEMIQNKHIHKLKIQQSNYMKKGKYPIIDQSKLSIAGYTDDLSLVNDILPVLVFGDHTLIIKFIDFPFVIGADGTKVIYLIENKYFSKFVYYSILNKNLKSEGYKRHFSKLKRQYFFIPAYSEQQKIASILSEVDAYIQSNQQYKEKIIKLKKGLIQKLLTGQIRVKF